MLEARQRIQLTQSDIVKLDVDALVTAANEQLAGGGGVDGAIHDAAGPELLAASLALAPCPAGQARITPAFNLASQYVIHAVGPIYRDGNQQEPEKLRNAYRSVLSLCLDQAIDSVAFPCISTGVYGYPKRDAAVIATESVIQWLAEHAKPQTVIFCCFAQEDLNIYRDLLQQDHD